MFKHEKQYLNPVRVDRPNPNYAALLQEQLGGPRGTESRPAIPVPKVCGSKDKEIKDLFLDVAAEELCHLEMISATVNMLNGDDLDAMNATVGNVEAHVLTGLTPMLANASGYLWTAAYVNETPATPRRISCRISRPNSGPRWFTNTCTAR